MQYQYGHPHDRQKSSGKILSSMLYWDGDTVTLSVSDGAGENETVSVLLQHSTHWQSFGEKDCIFLSNRLIISIG